MLKEVKIYSPAGHLMRHGFKNETGKYCGIVKEYYANKKYVRSIGKLKSILNYVNGKKSGLQKYYNQHGIVINNVRVYSEDYPSRTTEILKDKNIYRQYRNDYKSVDISVYKKDESISFNNNGISHYISRINYTCRYYFKNENQFSKHIVCNGAAKFVYYDNNKIVMTISDGKLKYDKTFVDNGNNIEISYQNVSVSNASINLIELFGYENLSSEDIAYLKLKFS